MDRIPDPNNQEQTESQIPESSAVLDQSKEAPESSLTVLSFARYSKSQCQIDEMNNKEAKKSLKTIRDIGVSIRTETDFKTKLPKLRIERVLPNGDYSKLYKALPPDIEVKEAKIDSDKCRLFFYMVDQMLFVLAIRKDHLNTR